MQNIILPAHGLAPLEELQAAVEALAARSEPDYVCDMPALRSEASFVVVNFDDRPVCSVQGDEIVLRLNGADCDYLFTEWSRQQLIDHLGTKEKWFRSVTLDDQARELNRRVHVLDRQRIRRMRSDEGIGFVRGLVSITYSDIPDIEILSALRRVMPEGEYLRNYSGRTDRNLYVYALLRQAPIGVGRAFTGYPGVVIKNSEVGANALWVIPYFVTLLPNGRLRPIAIREKALLRKIHRGRYGDLQDALASALQAVEGVWAPLQDKLRALQSFRFATQDEAIDRLTKVLTRLRMSQRFIRACTTTYGAAHHSAHHGLALFMALLETCATSALDSRYDDAEVAGSVLLHLL